MALTATNTLGFERSRNLAGHPANSITLNGSSGTTYTQGNLLGIVPAGLAAGGTLITVTSTAIPGTDVLLAGPCEATLACDASTKAVSVTAVPSEVFTVSFDGHIDIGSGSTLRTASIFASTEWTSAGQPLGAMLYVYEGPSKGDIRTVTAASSSGTSFTVNSPFTQTLSSASKAIVLCSTAAASAGVNIGSVVKVSTASNSKVAVNSTALGTGYLQVLAIDPENLKMDVAILPNRTVFGGACAT